VIFHSELNLLINKLSNEDKKKDICSSILIKLHNYFLIYRRVCNNQSAIKNNYTKVTQFELRLIS
jgi:hypothetical protein